MDGESPVEEHHKAAHAFISCFASMSHHEAMARTLGLEPRDGDWEKVFVEDAVARAREGFREYWAGPVPPAPRQGQGSIQLTAALAVELQLDTARSGAFPRGYRQIAHLLRPERVWVAWRYVRPGEQTGPAWDGLVWVDDHWAWFPKPWRALGT